MTAGEIGAAGAMTALLKDALDPNLVQTLENNPAIIHGGPFANIAHGCNSVLATKLSLSLADYTITEAGFGADLGWAPHSRGHNFCNPLWNSSSLFAGAGIPPCSGLRFIVYCIEMNVS